MRLLALVLPIGLCLVSCAKKDVTPPAGQHATVTLRDGSSYTGRVIASTPELITLVGDDNQSRMLNMPNVKTIEYWETPVAQTQPQAQAQTQPQAQAQAQQQPEPPHPEHYHAPQSAIRTKTYVVPVGTHISVRNEETIDSRQAVEGQTFA